MEDVEKYIENKYDFQVDEDEIWSLEDIEKAYDKFQRLPDRKKLSLALMIISHMPRRNEINEKAETDHLVDIEREKFTNLAE